MRPGIQKSDCLTSVFTSWGNENTVPLPNFEAFHALSHSHTGQNTCAALMLSAWSSARGATRKCTSGTSSWAGCPPQGRPQMLRTVAPKPTHSTGSPVPCPQENSEVGVTRTPLPGHQGSCLCHESPQKPRTGELLGSRPDGGSWRELSREDTCLGTNPQPPP